MALQPHLLCGLLLACDAGWVLQQLHVGVVMMSAAAEQTYCYSYSYILHSTLHTNFFMSNQVVYVTK